MAAPSSGLAALPAAGSAFVSVVAGAAAVGSVVAGFLSLPHAPIASAELITNAETMSLFFMRRYYRFQAARLASSHEVYRDDRRKPEANESQRKPTNDAAAGSAETVRSLDLWFNLAVAARLVWTHDASKMIELRGVAMTIGRSADCDFQVNDERVSSRHCRLALYDGAWLIEDLRSTNRTFVNGTPVGEQARRLNHGDLVRLGGADAVLLEVRFVADGRAPQASEAPRVDDARHNAQEAALRQKLAELQAELRERNAELVRMSEQARRWQAERAALHAERGERATTIAAAERINATLLAELDALRGELAREQAELAASRDATHRAERRITDLEALLTSQERRGRSDASDVILRTKDLESRLRMALSDLAVAREAVATGEANLTAVRQAYDDALTRLDVLAPRSPESSG